MPCTHSHTLHLHLRPALAPTPCGLVFAPGQHQQNVAKCIPIECNKISNFQPFSLDCKPQFGLSLHLHSRLCPPLRPLFLATLQTATATWTLPLHLQKATWTLPALTPVPCTHTCTLHSHLHLLFLATFQTADSNLGPTLSPAEEHCRPSIAPH